MGTQYWSEWEEQSENDLVTMAKFPKGLERAWKNSRYVVQAFKPRDTAWGTFIKVGIRRNDEAAVRSWSEIQRIKNELFGEEAVAIEFFPAESKLVDVANLYWIWVTRAPVPEEFKI